MVVPPFHTPTWSIFSRKEAEFPFISAASFPKMTWNSWKTSTTGIAPQRMIATENTTSATPKGTLECQACLGWWKSYNLARSTIYSICWEASHGKPNPLFLQKNLRCLLFLWQAALGRRTGNRLAGLIVGANWLVGKFPVGLWLLFCGFNPPKEGLLCNQNKGLLGSRYKYITYKQVTISERIYIYINIHIPRW